MAQADVLSWEKPFQRDSSLAPPMFPLTLQWNIGSLVGYKTGWFVIRVLNANHSGLEQSDAFLSKIELWWASGRGQGKQALFYLLPQGTGIHFNGREKSYCTSCILLLTFSLSFSSFFRETPGLALLSRLASVSESGCSFLTTEMIGMYHETSVSPLFTNIPQPVWRPSIRRADAQILWWCSVFFDFLNSNKLSFAPLVYVTFVLKKYRNSFLYIDIL